MMGHPIPLAVDNRAQAGSIEAARNSHDQTASRAQPESNGLAARRHGDTVGNPPSVGQFEHRDGHVQSLPVPDTAGAGSATIASRAGSIHARNRVSSHKPGTVATMQNRKKPSQPSHSAR